MWEEINLEKLSNVVYPINHNRNRHSSNQKRSNDDTHPPTNTIKGKTEILFLTREEQSKTLSLYTEAEESIIIYETTSLSYANNL